MDPRLDLLIKMHEKTQADLESLSDDVALIKEKLAEQKGERKAWGSLGAWINGALMVVLAAYFEWKFNRLN